MKDSPSSSAQSGSSHPTQKTSQDNFFIEILSTNHGSRNDAPLGTLESSEPAPGSESNNNNKKKKIEDEIDMKYKSFKQFDIVQEHSDHHFSKQGFFINGFTLKGDSKNWVKRIQYEWQILEKDLPEMIFVRAYEDRMDLLRAVIIGAAGTPYHDSLFFFDICFPSSYPNKPPCVHYHSGGLSINPNLYPSGKVCLSLLNTWSGLSSERWTPSSSTMLQVLVSIQGLILNAKPYFNEPGRTDDPNHHGKQMLSLAFNEEAFLSSCRTMVYSMRRPPRHFEDFVPGHFRKRGPAILAACVAYMSGAQVGCVVGEDLRGGGGSNLRSSAQFRSWLSKLFELLLREFTIRGADCDEVVARRAEHGAADGAGGGGDVVWGDEDGYGGPPSKLLFFLIFVNMFSLFSLVIFFF